jgi:hypothetical protein
LSREGATHGIPCPRKREKQGVALSVDFGSSGIGRRLANDTAMLRNELPVTIAELLKQTRRASMSLKRNVTVPTGRLAIGSIVYNNVKKAGEPLVAEGITNHTRRKRESSEDGPARSTSLLPGPRRRDKSQDRSGFYF